MWAIRLAALSLWLLSSSQVAHANSEKICRELYKLGTYVRASQCYENLAKSKRPPLTIVQKYEVGLWLANAAQNLSKAANKEKDLAKASYYNERAVALCSEYLRRKLHDTPSSRKRIQNLRLRLSAQIGYATLTISSGHKQANIQIKGFKYQSTARENFSKKLRPGTYKVVVTYPKMQKLRRTVSLQKGKVKLVSLTPPKGQGTTTPPAPPTKRAPIWPPVLLGVGVATAVGGAVALGLGVGVTQSERDALFAKNDRDPATTKKIQQLDETSRTQANIGYILLGVGAALAIAGGVTWAIVGKAAPPPTPTDSPKAQLFFFALP